MYLCSYTIRLLWCACSIEEVWGGDRDEDTHCGILPLAGLAGRSGDEVFHHKSAYV